VRGEFPPVELCRAERRGYKTATRFSSGLTTAGAAADPLTPAAFERIEELRQRVVRSSDDAEGIRAFRDKRKPVFVGK
jgi:hypothetical protein